jgi:hypothetical protein
MKTRRSATSGLAKPPLPGERSLLCQRNDVKAPAETSKKLDAYSGEKPSPSHERRRILV